MRLSDLANGRDNNFNLIRITAAYAVLVTHSFALAVGSGDAEPFRELLGMTLGSIAVDTFFVTSGFLVTASILNRQNVIGFIWARFLRIYPAIFALLVLTILGVGLFFTTVPWDSYLTAPATFRYLRKCATLITGVVYELPGVFEANPYKKAVNGSLWTLPYEVRMYATLALVWAISYCLPGQRMNSFRHLTVSLAIIAACLVFADYLGIRKSQSEGLRLFFMFFVGASFYLLRKRILLSKWIFRSAVTALLVSTVDARIFLLVYLVTLAYVLLYVAYVPAGPARKFNRFGDYSYGVYIYAFPVQQSIAAVIPGVSILSMLILSTLLTFPLAIISWHFVEKRALKLKS